ncbi:HAD-IA family hydrolase [Rhizobium sp. CG5]|uniref:HAD-IA family hydrolase n=1 Tax=Rhizobium sp. CG5 TaxID=2726076 RepID=UPI002033B7E9|nr:HAD-IA family hydrolase [Rhizobium sp. CG5]
MTSPSSTGFDKRYQGFLFDMDGTLLNSIAAAERVWGQWAARHGLDVAAFLPTMHGKRGIDTIRGLGLPGVNVEAEALEIERGEIEDVDGVVALPGAIDFLKGLPAERWAIVTSAPVKLARARIEAAGLPQPPEIVTAEDVKIGKPDPAGYRLGASRIKADPARCLVFEDVMAGVLAGEAAGADVMVITATHSHLLETRYPTLESYEGLQVHVDAMGDMQIVRMA